MTSLSPSKLAALLPAALTSGSEGELALAALLRHVWASQPSSPPEFALQRHIGATKSLARDGATSTQLAKDHWASLQELHPELTSFCELVHAGYALRPGRMDEIASLSDEQFVQLAHEGVVAPARWELTRDEALGKISRDLVLAPFTKSEHGDWAGSLVRFVPGAYDEAAVRADTALLRSLWDSPTAPSTEELDELTSASLRLAGFLQTEVAASVARGEAPDALADELHLDALRFLPASLRMTLVRPAGPLQAAFCALLPKAMGLAPV